MKDKVGKKWEYKREKSLWNAILWTEHSHRSHELKAAIDPALGIHKPGPNSSEVRMEGEHWEPNLLLLNYDTDRFMEREPLHSTVYSLKTLPNTNG